MLDDHQRNERLQWCQAEPDRPMPQALERGRGEGRQPIARPAGPMSMCIEEPAKTDFFDGKPDAEQQLRLL